MIPAQDDAKKTDTYHHGHLREELLRLGLEALEREGADRFSLRSLAEAAGVSKTAPYRHFRDKDLFLGALADEGYHMLHKSLLSVAGSSPDAVARMGRAYMAFAAARPALYRLMNSPLMCRLPEELTRWARESLLLLAGALAESRPRSGGRGKGAANSQGDPGRVSNGPPALDAAVAAWAYIHGLVLIRIDGLFPRDLPEPDWNRLAGVVPEIPDDADR